MTGPVVVVHSRDGTLAESLVGQVDDLAVVRAADGSELGRLLTEDLDVALLLTDQVGEGERAWDRVALIRTELPALPIVAYVDEDLPAWDRRSGPCPATAVVRAPAEGSVLAGALRVAARLTTDDEEPTPPTPGPTAVGVIGTSGGCGATTLAVLLAARAALHGPTTLLDLDRRHGEVAATLRLDPTYSTRDLAPLRDDPVQLAEVLPSSLTDAGDGLRVLAGPEVPDDHDALTSFAGVKPLAAVLGAASQLGSTVVADLGDLPVADLPALAELSTVVVVVPHDIRVVRRLPLLLDLLADRCPGTEVRTVLNREVRGTPPSAGELATLVRRPWDATVAWTKAIPAATNDTRGRGLVQLARRPPRGLAAALAALAPDAAAPAGARRGLLTRRDR